MSSWRTDIPPPLVEKFDKIDRGSNPFTAVVYSDSSNALSELLWVGDLSYPDPQDSAMIRVALAQSSFYSDISDAKESRGYRRLTDPGGLAALLQLQALCQSVISTISFRGKNES